MAHDVCVVIPVYNEAEVVGDVVAEVRREFPKVACVDDGSQDQSAEICERAGARVLRHPVNLGQGAALRTGIEFGLLDPSVRAFVTFDADGQHDVRDVSGMLAMLDRDETQVVFGSRFLDGRTELTPARRLVLRAGVRYTRLTTGMAVTDTHNGLRVFTREVASALRLEMNGMAHGSEILEIVGNGDFRYAEAPVHIRYTDYSRAKGQPLLNSVNILVDLFLR